jgi:periplasmic divalent cation tolerance protein
VSDLILILSTTPDRAEAERIAEALVTEKLAACVQLSAVDSIYRWQGAIERAAEVRLAIKTRAALAESVEARIKALHSYDTPEIVIVPIIGGSAEYLDWLAAESD